MSCVIGIKAKLRTDWCSDQSSECIFSIIKYGCEKKLGITLEIDDRGDYDLANDETLLYVDHSFVYNVADPLLGRDNDWEVKEFRPKPLFERLSLLQDLFSFILSQDNVIRIEVFITEYGYVIFTKDGKLLPKDKMLRQTKLENFAKETEQMIENSNGTVHDSLYYWEKYENH